MKNKNIEDFLEEIKVTFSDRKLIKQVFIHRSYINEHLEQNLENNERLEFLGDAVLELVVTDHLYRTYPNPEGELTNWRSAIVKGEMLAIVAKELDMGALLLVSRGEERNGGKTSNPLLANAFEALIGAIYLDSGYDQAKTFIHNFLIVRLDDIIIDGSYFDSKSRLQELVQEKDNITPTYEVLNETGPDHDKHFTIAVFVADKKIGVGEGSSKRRGEQEAATAALKNYL